MLSNKKHYVSDTSFYFLKTFPVLNSKEILESIIYIELLRRNFTVSRGVLKNDEITFVSKD